jgi:hypothetical protein
MARLTKLRATPKSRAERHGVIVMKGSARRPGRPRRLGRLLLGRNELRRATDRIEALIVASLMAAFLTAAVVAGVLAGHLYQSQHTMAARVRPAVAVLAQPGPVATSQTMTVGATWRLPKWNAAVRHPDHGDHPRHLLRVGWNLRAGMAGPLWTASGFPAQSIRNDCHRGLRRHHRYGRCHRRSHPLLLLVPRAPGSASPRQLGVDLGRRRPAMDEPPVTPPLPHIPDDATG